MECFYFFFFKQKTAYEMRISDWSSDVCSSDLQSHLLVLLTAGANSAARPVARAAGFFAGCAHAQGNETVPPAINPCSMQRNANAEEHPWRSRRICGFEASEINRRCGRCGPGSGRRLGHCVDEPVRTRPPAGGGDRR